GGHPLGQQEIHEHEALGGGFGRRLYCRLTSLSRSLQTILRINLDGTLIKPVFLTFFSEKANKYVKTPHFRAEFSVLHLSSTHSGTPDWIRTSGL
ncbi:hypothetical protein, partial [Dysosmobacter sp.]|uniref:hypothetical protein n=1 Tax=Dysosmobacter sp. TaxID=2591382 RepID=UPI003AEF8081